MHGLTEKLRLGIDLVASAGNCWLVVAYSSHRCIGISKIQFSTITNGFGDKLKYCTQMSQNISFKVKGFLSNLALCSTSESAEDYIKESHKNIVYLQ